MTAESVSAVVTLAREHGLRVERPAVLRDVVNVVVDLAPSGVVWVGNILEVVRAKNVPLSVLEGKLDWWRRCA